MATHMLRRGRHAGRVTRNVGDSGARRGERGAALVEAAIVTPLLLMLVFGIIEFGFAFKDTLTLANGSRSGARVASAAGTDPSADWFVLQAVKGATGSLANVNEIVVFKATGPNGVVPASCASGTPSGGSCNVYTAADLLIDQPTFLSASYTKKNSWLATSRQTSISAVGGPDYLGVYIRALHTSAMQAIVPSRNLTDTVVMRLEPTR